MSDSKRAAEQKPGISKVKLAVGAASLFLFIVGLKKTFRDVDAQGLEGPADRARPGS